MKRYVGYLITLLCLISIPASAHGNASQNYTYAGVLKMTVFAQLSSPEDQDEFLAVDRIDFTSDTEHKIMLKNDSSSSQTYHYSYSFQLKAGLEGGALAYLAGAGTAPGMTIGWGASPNQEITAQVSTLDPHWDNTAVGDYTAQAYTKVTRPSTSTSVEVDHDHTFFVDLF